jgi:hypothetical protein
LIRLAKETLGSLAQELAQAPEEEPQQNEDRDAKDEASRDPADGPHDSTLVFSFTPRA